MARTPKKSETTWIVYLLGGKRAGRLGTVTALDADAAIAVIAEFKITDPERQGRVIVRPIASRFLRLRSPTDMVS
jgi:hypothetical protein